MIQYEGTLYRPPSEADSLILQATIGCSYNECSFCEMYRDKKFRVRPLAELQQEIETAREVAPWVRKVFLADGDALIAKASFLGTLCDELRAAFPKLRRISCYASPQALQVRSVDEMRALRSTRHQRELQVATCCLVIAIGLALAVIAAGVALAATAAGAALAALAALAAR